MTNREFWKRQFIIASRQKRPASFGFYFPAKSDAKREGSINRRKVGSHVIYGIFFNDGLMKKDVDALYHCPERAHFYIA